MYNSHLESKPCFAQPACDANYVTSRRCWRLQEGCLEHALIGGVTFFFFLTVRTQTQKTILSSLLDLGQQASTATFFQRRRFHFNFKSSILFELNLQLNRLRLFYFG